MNARKKATVAIAAGALIVSGTAVGAANFADVDPASTFAGAIDRMSTSGIIEGDGDGNFRPEDPITRGETAIIADRLFNELSTEVLGVEIDNEELQGPAGPAGTPGDDGVDGVAATDVINFGEVAGLNIGGPFGKFFNDQNGDVLGETKDYRGGVQVDGRANFVGAFGLPAGTYTITSDAFFRLEATPSDSEATRLFFALRVDDGSADFDDDDGLDGFGADLGTCLTSKTNDVINSDYQCTSTRTVTLDAPVTVQAFAFGYEDDQSSEDGVFDLERAMITVQQVQAASLISPVAGATFETPAIPTANPVETLPLPIPDPAAAS